MGKSLRIFTWGVGYDVDTRLLDRLAEIGNGVSEYVKPKEDIAAKVQAFYHKSSSPVLTGLNLEVLNDKVQLVNMYPKKLSDLYAGSQLVVIGQYTGAGPVAIRLSGEVNGKPQQFVYESDFTNQNSKNAFIEPLWAKRRIGHLLDTIRLHGESKELVEDVIRLSREYGTARPCRRKSNQRNPWRALTQRTLTLAIAAEEAGAAVLLTASWRKTRGTAHKPWPKMRRAKSPGRTRRRPNKRPQSRQRTRRHQRQRPLPNRNPGRQVLPQPRARFPMTKLRS
jgi:hypothetical protein